MIRITFPVGLLGCNCSIIGDAESGDAIVVDPGADLPHILQQLGSRGLTATKIFVTHAHIDHIAGALALKNVTKAPIFYSKDDLPLVAMMDQQAGWLNTSVPEVAPPDHSPGDGEMFFVGALETEVLHTPGHTQGSLCLHLPAENLLLAGDTLFAGSVGRTDLPGGQHKQLIASIQEKLMTLPDTTQVVPGHGAETTIGDERETNPFLLDG